jgi:outer membrane receptor protein involved in Fe transport
VRKIICVFFSLYAMLFSGTTGKIVGTAVDKTTGLPLVGVNIVLQQLPLGAATDEDGYYLITNVPPGTYTLQATYIGYRDMEVQNVIVNIDQTTQIRIDMQETTIDLSDAITVVAERPIIKKDVTSKRAVIDGNLITDVLPVSNLNDVLSLQAGIVSDENGNIHIRGGRLGEVAYMIDGTYVRNPFYNSLGSNVDVEAIQEMEVISGTFNAEYGNALSGVVNIVTKQGGSDYKVKLQYESPMLNESPYHKADWYLDEDEIKNLSPEERQKYRDAVRLENDESAYKHIGVLDSRFAPDITGIGILGKFNGSLSGPIPAFDDAHFFIAGTFRNEDSYLPYGFSLERIISSKITYRVTPSINIQINADWSNEWFQDYDHQYKYWQYFDSQGEGAYPLRRDRKYRLTFKGTHTLSNNTFYTLSYSYIDNFEKRGIDGKTVITNLTGDSLIYSDYITRGYWAGIEGDFRTGDDRYWYRTHSKTNDLDFNFISQVHRYHQIKAGVEFRWHEMFRKRVGMPPREQFEFFTKYPFESAFYIQDKIELDFMIMNVGLRFDYFKVEDTYFQDPGRILQTVTDAQGQSDIITVPQKEVPARFKVSPRIGLAYPITEETVFHFAYGHFFQIPRFYDLYRNNDLNDILANDALVGNPGLEPEETVAFEAGVKQQLGRDYALDITAYYKDISNLISSFYYFSGRDYTIFINADYGRVQGVDVSLNKRYSSYFAGALNYTFMVAMGNESDPIEGYSQYREESANLKPNRNFFLDFDRRHNFNLNINISFPNDFGPQISSIHPFENVSANFVFSAASGLPYTPSSRDPDATVEPEKNSARKPWVNQLDVRISKEIYWGGVSFNA